MVKLSGEKPALVFVFATPRYDLPALLAAVRSITGEAPLVGASGSGEIVNGEYLGFGEGVAVLVLTSGGYRFGIASRGHIRGDLDRAGQALTHASQQAAGSSPHAAVLLLIDTMAGDLQEFVHGVYRVTGPKVALVGAGAGDEQKFVRTVVFHDDAVIEEGAVVVWIASQHPLQVITRHGWRPIGIPLLVTRAQGTEIIELNGRPAADVYAEQIGIGAGQLSPEQYWATAIRHPFGLLQPDGSTVIRVPRTKTPQGTLTTHGCIPATGAAVQVMEGSAESLMSISGPVVEESLRANPEARVVLTFSCAARAKIFGPRAAEEARLMQAAAGDKCAFGFYCCAEFARTAGVLGTHNATLTTLAL